MENGLQHSEILREDGHGFDTIPQEIRTEMAMENLWHRMADDAYGLTHDWVSDPTDDLAKLITMFAKARGAHNSLIHLQAGETREGNRKERAILVREIFSDIETAIETLFSKAAETAAKAV